MLESDVLRINQGKAIWKSRVLEVKPQAGSQGSQSSVSDTTYSKWNVTIWHKRFLSVGVWTLDYILGVAIVDKPLIMDFSSNFSEIDYWAHLLSAHHVPDTGFSAGMH